VTPGAAGAAASGPSAQSTSQGKQAATLTGASALRREVFGFATAGSLADPTIGYPSWNFDDLSTVAFFALNFRYDGQLLGDSDFAVWSSSALTGLVSTAHAHGSKVVVTIVGPHNPVDQCDALYNDKQSISQLIPQVIAKGVDGVNIDYEGQLQMCQNVVDPTLNALNQTLLTNFAKDLRAALDAVKPGYYLSIDTYSGSALGTGGFFNIPDLNKYVDAFFVMAYDMDYANQPYPPLSCPSFCMNPVSPVGTIPPSTSVYYWNDAISMTQYSALVGAGKTILGQPYYGRVACVASPVEHAQATAYLTAATYIGAATAASSPDIAPGTYVVHRDSSDTAGMDRWDSWYDNSLGCWREMYWSDTTTLAVRYQLVSQMNLRGVGFWTLNYGGGSAELWSALQTYFKGCYSVAVNTNPASTALAGTSVAVNATAGCPDPSPQYQFWVLAPGASRWTLAQAYSTSSTYTWNTAGLFPGAYRIAVWARDAGSGGEFGNTLGTWDTSNADTVYTVTTDPCSAATLTAVPAATATVGTGVGVTAHASGCPNPLYQFWILAPGAGSFTLAQAYSTTATYALNTTNKAPGAYVLAIWTRDVSSPGTFANSLGRWDAVGTSPYTVTTCSAASISSAPSSARAGTPVTFTATAAGCPNPSPVYQFWVLAPGASSWTMVQAYSTSNSLSWTTAGKVPGNYQIAVWVRDASSGGAFSNSLGGWDVAASNAFRLNSAACTNVSLSAAPPAAATVGTSVTFTATGTCPDGSPVYQFWVLAPGAGSWTVAQAYSTTNTLSWSTLGKVPGPYQIAVWVRDVNSAGAFSNGLGTWDVGTFGPYTLK
jgi:Glycosyl hydrolases family 18